MAAIKAMTKYPVLLALMLALAAPAVQAMPGGGRFFQARDGHRPNGQQRDRPQQQPNYQREEPQRFQRRDEGNAGEQQRQRLSPEERRQLRRDIHDAGRDIYRR